MISIITAVYNQLAMNKLYWEYLLQYTTVSFELIIIDNGSIDGSREFFQSLPSDKVTVIANDENYSYPHCQNQGIAIAKYDVLVFFNNDLLVSPQWDTRLLEVLKKNKHELVSFASNDRLCNSRETKKISRKWKRIKYAVMFFGGQHRFSLQVMHRLCYGNWGKYCEKIFKRYGFSYTIGFSGSAIAATRSAVEKLAMWDKTQQGADFNLFYSSCFRSETMRDIEPMATINGIFVHHYRRLTLYGENYPPFADRKNLKTWEDNWTAEQLQRWNRYINEF